MKLVAACVLLSACVVAPHYVVNRADYDSGAPAIPARRVKGDVPVTLASDAILRDKTVPLDDARLRIRAGRKSGKVLAGHILTWVGTPISIVGTILFLTDLDLRGAQFITGLVMAGAAEPLMIAGTVVWIQGSREHRGEVP
jgi:hypothetical protein